MWRKIIGWGIVVCGMGVIVGVGWLVYSRQIAPYRWQKLSTVPQGVSSDALSGGSNLPTTAQQAPRAVLVTAVVASAPVSRGFEAPVSLRIDIVDSNNQVISDGSSMTVTLSSSSPTGKFDSGVAAIIPSGRQTALVKYQDTSSGRATITAFVSGLVSGGADIVLLPGKAVSLSEIAPVNHSPQVGQTAGYRVNLLDSFGNVASGGQVAWTLTNADSGAAVGAQQLITADDSGLSRFSFNPTTAMIGRKLTLTASFLAQKQTLQLTPTN